ncbi:hypothetical protein AcW2_000996 [Taiwanofungus camphoratus]|nr:hypothetical protein AcW2_000996 [Antrodia cinnamomea]
MVSILGQRRAPEGQRSQSHSNYLQRFLQRAPRHATCPIDSLPFDVLEVIFGFGYDLCICDKTGKNSSLSRTDQDCYCRHSFRNTICGVSHDWRQAASAIPRLWTAIQITASTPPNLLAIYLEHSKNFPLDLLMSISHPGTQCKVAPLSEDGLLALMEVVLVHHQRWRQLHIHIGKLMYDLVIPTMLKLGDLHVPNLEVLYVHMPPILLQSDNMFPNLFRGGAPLLHNVELHNCGSPLSHLNASGLTFPSLQSLWIDRATGPLSYLNNFANNSLALTHLTLSNSFAYIPKIDESLYRLVVPALRSLRIHHWTETALILELLFAPLLEVLQIEYLSATEPETADNYIVALQRYTIVQSWGKFPSLRSLRVQVNGECLITGERLRAFLQSFPTITHLTFISRHIDRFVEEFAKLHTEGSAVLLPCLEEMALGDAGGNRGREIHDAVMTLASVRQAAEIPLKSVQIPANGVWAFGHRLPQTYYKHRNMNIDVKIEPLPCSPRFDMVSAWI